MTTAVLVASPPMIVRLFGHQVRRDREVREASRQKRHEILDEIVQHPDADPGLRRQAEFYRRRLEAGTEGDDDDQR